MGKYKEEKLNYLWDLIYPLMAFALFKLELIPNWILAYVCLLIITKIIWKD